MSAHWGRPEVIDRRRKRRFRPNAKESSRSDLFDNFIGARENGFSTRSALKKPQTTLGTVNLDYIEDHDPAFRKPDACTRIPNTPWHR
jgi:hypothetical protein